MRIRILLLVSAVSICMTLPILLRAQAPRGQAAAPTARAAAPIDLTGDWVSYVTEDWRFRMVTPQKGDYLSVPLNAEGTRLADAWDPAKDEAAGTQCKAYGAPAIMRVPGRLHITWQDDNTLRIDTDAGTQTRQFQFGPVQPQRGETTWQGNSSAQWEFAGGGRGGQAGQGRGGFLKVVTRNIRPGYLRKNGVPYSANAVVTEYFSQFTEPNGDSYLVVQTFVEDPQYLTQPFITSTHFKKLPDASGWNPTPCSAR